MSLSHAQLLELLTDQAFKLDRLGDAIETQNKTIKLQRKQLIELRDRLGVKGRQKKRGY